MDTNEIVEECLRVATENTRKTLEGAIAEALLRERTELIEMMERAGINARNMAKETANSSKSCELHGSADTYFKVVNLLEARKFGRGN
jgi:copper homeostasis protein CutC